MKRAFSTQRQASNTSGMSYLRQMALTSLMLAIDTGWPAAVLLVMVSSTMGILSTPYSLITSSRRSVSMLPFQGFSVQIFSTGNGSCRFLANRFMGWNRLLRALPSVVSKKPFEGMMYFTLSPVRSYSTVCSDLYSRFSAQRPCGQMKKLGRSSWKVPPLTKPPS